MDKDIEQELETLQSAVESYYKDIHFHENTIKTLEDLIGGKKPLILKSCQMNMLSYRLKRKRLNKQSMMSVVS